MCDVCLVFISILINYSNEFIMQIRMGIENVVCAIVVSLVTINTRRNTQSHTNWWRESYTFIVMRMQKPRADEIIRNKYSNMFPWIHNNPLVYGFVIQYHLWEFIRINSRRRIQSAHAGSGVRQKDKQTEPKKKKTVMRLLFFIFLSASFTYNHLARCCDWWHFNSFLHLSPQSFRFHNNHINLLIEKIKTHLIKSIR